MLPNEAEPRFLINPRGYLFQELKASDLIVCDLEGRVLRGSGELRKVAFHIHTRIHLANPAATCVIHVHPRHLTALSMVQGADTQWHPGPRPLPSPIRRNRGRGPVPVPADLPESGTQERSPRPRFPSAVRALPWRVFPV
jgi:ribulose-5-phosphate 4-epimerase/fuculose-1-phosphate aldolase